ncbi:MAG: 16S rRNA (guanine(966)-N(2))-methyltransferase RsmD [Actinobacteria bacterium]|nr:16S rRNA (guanine(966)-N(2))-methyltransferase RsmD [Actinomycetota bacterium]
MTRVIAGTARGRRLQVPPGGTTRPTSDRVREALFSVLGPRVPGAAVADLFAGSGGLGIEALSRGAARAVFVDADPRAAAAIRANLRATGLAGAATVVRGDADAFCARPRGHPFHLVLVDPPYTRPLGRVWSSLTALRDTGGLAPAATVVVERDRRDAALTRGPPAWLALDHPRSYGDTVLLVMRRPPDGTEPVS